MVRFVITGVWKGYTENELKAMLLQVNRDVYNAFGEASIHETKEITSMRCRNEDKASIVFEARINIYKHLVKKQRTLWCQYVTSATNIDIPKNSAKTSRCATSVEARTWAGTAEQQSMTTLQGTGH